MPGSQKSEVGISAAPVSRRDLLRTVGGLSAATFSIIDPGAVRGSPANSRISVGLIGAGNRGNYDASIVHADPRAAITAVCDLFDDRLEAAPQKIKVQNPEASEVGQALSRNLQKWPPARKRHSGRVGPDRLLVH